MQPQSAIMNLAFQDWLGLLGLAIAQTITLVGVLWRFASRMQKMETNLENLTGNITGDLGKRVSRLEDLSFQRA